MNIDRTSLTMGWLVGRQIAGMRTETGKTPVAYLYNGVQLPALPEWDKETYPHAFIAHTGKMFTYLFVLSDPTYLVGIEGDWCIKCVNHSTLNKSTGVWIPGSGNTIERSVHSLVWSNFDMVSRDGSIAMSASDPIPVYE